MKRLHVTLVCLVVSAFIYGSSVQHVSCSEATPDPQAQSTQGHTAPKEDSEGSEDLKVEQDGESWLADAQSLPEPLVLSRVELEELTEDTVIPQQHDQAMEMDVATYDDREELALSSVSESEADVELTTSEAPTPISHEQESVVTGPASSVPTVPPTTEDASSSPASPESTHSSVPETLVDAGMSSQLTPDDCVAGESPPFDGPLTNFPAVIENSSVPGTNKGTSIEAALDHASQGANTSSMLKEQGSHTGTEPDPSGKDPEDIPTFDEWKKIMMAENEKIQTTHTSSGGAPQPGKKAQKPFTNYASVECGAKVLSTNPEAKSTSAILMENMDVYMLNPCSNKIWFVIELCQPIQVKQLDIANFELFSSTPKDFLVSISDRYPTNKWVKLGTFHARDERTVQSFPLDEHLYAKYVKMFAKYIKVELLSHFGAEHFCPLSLIRVYGTSMMEEYEMNSDPTERQTFQDEDYEFPTDFLPSEDKSSKNLLRSAKDVILNMVNDIAANVLGVGPEGEGNYSTDGLNLTEMSVLPQPPSTSSNLPEMVEMMEMVQPEPTDLPSITPTEDTPEFEKPMPTAPIPEAPPTDTLCPVPPKEEQIVTLLPDEEEESEQGFGPIGGEEAGIEEQDPRSSRAKMDALYCEDLSDRSCAPSLQDYLLRYCSSPLALRRRRKKAPESQSEPHTPSPRHPPTQRQNATAPTPPTWPLSELPTPSELPPGGAPALGFGELAPSLTSALPNPLSTDTLSAKATQTVDFISSTAADPPAKDEPHRLETTMEAQVELKTSSSHQTSSSSSGLLASDSLSYTEMVPTPEGNMPTLKAPADALDMTNTPLPSMPTQPEQSSPAGPQTTRVELDETLEVIPTATPAEEAATSVEVRGDEPQEELIPSSDGFPRQPSSLSPSSTSTLDIYAEMQSGMELAGGSGGQAHGSSQKESVFMRLNNRIKSLEMNMSLSGRYLEQLSQRYRKQMEEMQRAFNKTIIKLQNTSRIAEEQDQRQTESIQMLQVQLENITSLVINLSVRVSQLQKEVADRQSYLMVCLILSVLLGLVLCAGQRRIFSTSSSAGSHTSIPKSYSNCSPKRGVSGEDESCLRRTASYPLLQSAFQIPTTEEGPDEAYNVEPLRQKPANKKSCKLKFGNQPETLVPSAVAAPLTANGALPRHSAPNSRDKKASGHALGPPPLSFKDPQSEGSSEGSSQSDEPSFCGIGACGRLCENTTAPPRGRAERRAYKRRRSKPSCVIAELLQAPRRTGTLQDLMRANKDMSAGTLGVMSASGPS